MPVRVTLQAPTMMFSITLIRSKIFGVWNVRTIPARLRSCTDWVVSDPAAERDSRRSEQAGSR